VPERCHIVAEALIRFDVSRFQPPCQGLRAMKGKGPTASGIRVKAVGETRFNAGALIEERKRPKMRWQSLRKPITILRGLYFNACECDAFFLGLNHPGRLAVNIEKIICKAMAARERNVSERDASPGIQMR
jgi:hypothetical protein